MESITDNFEFSDQHFLVSQIDAKRQRSMTERFISNSAYFSLQEVNVGVMRVPWDFLYDRSFKKEREMKLSETMEHWLQHRKFVVSHGSDWTRCYHIKHRFIENDYPNFSPHEIEKVEICDKELHSDIIRVSTVQIKFLILRYAQFLITEQRGLKIQVTQYCHLLEKCPAVSGIYEELHKYVCDLLGNTDFPDKLVDFASDKQNILISHEKLAEIGYKSHMNFFQQSVSEAISNIRENYGKRFRKCHPQSKIDSSVDVNNVKDEPFALLQDPLIHSPLPVVGGTTDSNTTTPIKVEEITFCHGVQALFDSTFTDTDSTVQTTSPSARIPVLPKKSAAVLPDSDLPENLTVVTPNTVCFAAFSTVTSTSTGRGVGITNVAATSSKATNDTTFVVNETTPHGNETTKKSSKRKSPSQNNTTRKKKHTPPKKSRPTDKPPGSIRKFFTGHGWYDGKVSTKESDGSEPITYRIDYNDNDYEDGITKHQLNAILKEGLIGVGEVGYEFLREFEGMFYSGKVRRNYDDDNKIECFINNDRSLHDYTPDQLMKFSTLMNTDNDKAYNP